jgi:hypothetical protein
MNIFSCNLSATSRNNRWIFPLIFIIFLLLVELVGSFILLPHLNSIYKYELSVSLAISLLLFFLKLFFSDPGFKTNKLNKSLLQLSLEGEVLNNVCPRCVNYIKSSVKHCYYCNKCVENFDHHCIWINNCIGGKNFNFFFLFLVLLFIKLVSNVVFSFECKILLNIALLTSVDSNVSLFKLKKYDFLYTNKVKNISSSVQIIFSLIVIIPIMYNKK